ncbi:ester cyclase [Streptomyces sp. HGB0020]|uniref:ester cyclase n=1 Tax=Streptomyces sp. HGB0020 TaxID=1078086 RepID=UPI00034E0103|nr:ester cyclase [Streptomyces sp. HGB0020]EPD69640.1 hypothetical protein HMPREF1211_00186 [Streptomyces sp. HGB0020]
MDTAETTLTRNKDIVHAFIDALFTKGDLGAVDDYLAEDFVNHNPPFGMPGDREGMRSAGAVFREALPDWHSEPYQMIAEGDLVVEHFAAAGTQRGDLLGVPAPAQDGPDRAVTLHGINIFRVRGDRIAEQWCQLDELGVLRQLGIISSKA